MRRLLRARVILGVCVLTTACASADDPALREQMLQAEDARGHGPEGLTPLETGLGSPDPATRRVAVRAIGRLEQPPHAHLVLPLLEDPDASVRAEAANALGQLATTPEAAASAAEALVARIDAETDPEVRGVLAATAGRLPLASPADIGRVETAIVTLLPSSPVDAAVAVAQVPGAAEGLEALIRQRREVRPPSASAIERLKSTALLGRSTGDGAEAGDPRVRGRRLAVLALGTAQAADAALLEQALGDPDDEVRRVAAASAGAMPTLERREALLRSALADRHAQVRYEALRGWGRRMTDTAGCDPVVAAVRDDDPHVALQALDLLGTVCTDGGVALAPLLRETDGPAPEAGSWHRAAHAIVSLARVSPAEARKRLTPFTTSQVWQVRMYAARAAGELAALDELMMLAADMDDNVRTAALTALVDLKRPEAVPVALDDLTRDDYQLILTAAGALADPQVAPRSVPALVATFQRLTAGGKDTSRDPRMAILDRLEALGGPDGRGAAGAPIEPSLVEALRPSVRDFDPAVATRVAGLLSAWTGSRVTAEPQPAGVPPPALADVEALRGQVLRLTIAGRGQMDLRLLLDEAPLSALRVATRAREGYYDGLTFHRVVPNFVLQGGSPGANEYMGDARYMRDEVGLVSNRRGTLGISTRGRDTGDAQIFVNLVDLPRLDHTYTVFAEIVRGLDVADGVLEGDVIEHAELVPAP
ncbi:MAG: HEAT repeat domain-containing protein [Vicinamibacterales bacterium]